MSGSKVASVRAGPSPRPGGADPARGAWRNHPGRWRGVVAHVFSDGRQFNTVGIQVLPSKQEVGLPCDEAWTVQLLRSILCPAR